MLEAETVTGRTNEAQYQVKRGLFHVERYRC
jgi:hypothetical protein